MPIPAIRTLFHEHKTLFATYEALYRFENSDGNRDRPPYERLRRPRQYKGLWEWRQIEPELEKAKNVVAKAEGISALVEPKFCLPADGDGR